MFECAIWMQVLVLKFVFILFSVRKLQPSPTFLVVLILITDDAEASYFAPGDVMTSTLLISLDFNLFSSFASLTRWWLI